MHIVVRREDLVTFTAANLEKRQVKAQSATIKRRGTGYKNHESLVFDGDQRGLSVNLLRVKGEDT